MKHFVIWFLVGICATAIHAQQGVTPPTNPVMLTGILLVADHRCANTHSADVLCRASDWALMSGRTTYLLFGDTKMLREFERQRVNVNGDLQIEPIVVSGLHLIRRRITVRWIEKSDLSEQAVEALVQRLRTVAWQGPVNRKTPMHWDFGFTDPMIELLQAGSGAQDVLLHHIKDPVIQDQVVMLLGGIGNERSIWPIIETLTDGKEATLDAKAEHLNLIGDLALTNLTVSEVIWYHGGGIPVNRCPDHPKSCWTHWWLEQRSSLGVDRDYVNYPNYGIYQQFDDAAVK